MSQFYEQELPDISKDNINEIDSKNGEMKSGSSSGVEKRRYMKKDP